VRQRLAQAQEERPAKPALKTVWVEVWAEYAVTLGRPAE
jgi:hypothetical protein